MASHIEKRYISMAETLLLTGSSPGWTVLIGLLARKSRGLDAVVHLCDDVDLGN